MDPLSIGAAVAAPIIGGLFQRKANKDNENLQREFAQNGIRWKVEDAKAAGLHPLYALGGMGATATPSAQPIMTGQDLSRAAQAFTTSTEQEIQKAQLEVLKAQADKDYALASAARSAEAREAQQAMFPQGSVEITPIPRPGTTTVQELPPLLPGQGSGNPLADRRIKMKADEVTAMKPGDRSVSAGSHSAFQEYYVTENLPMLLPRSDEGPSESLESIAWWQWPIILQRNREKYGDGWINQFYQQMVLGKNPKFRQAPPPAANRFPYGGGYKRGPGRSQ